MKRLHYLLSQVMQECAEIIQVASKADMFGLTSHHPANPPTETNIKRIREEFTDLLGMLMLVELEAGLTDGALTNVIEADLIAKFRKVEKYMQISRECGQLTEAPMTYDDPQVVIMTREELIRKLDQASEWNYRELTTRQRAEIPMETARKEVIEAIASETSETSEISVDSSS